MLTYCICIWVIVLVSHRVKFFLKSSRIVVCNCLSYTLVNYMQNGLIKEFFSAIRCLFVRSLRSCWQTFLLSSSPSLDKSQNESQGLIWRIMFLYILISFISLYGDIVILCQFSPVFCFVLPFFLSIKMHYLVKVFPWFLSGYWNIWGAALKRKYWN